MSTNIKEFHKKLHIPVVPTDGGIFYPETDGEPMAASDRHRKEMTRTLDSFEVHFQAKPDAYVSGDIFMYYVKGEPDAVVAPDILISFGLDKKDRPTYKVWEEGKVPEFVMEFASEKTHDKDLTIKKDTYASLGIRDYFLFDVQHLYLPVPLMGFSLVDDRYVRVSEGSVGGGLHAASLNLDFHVREDGLGIYDPVAGKWLQTAAEIQAARADREAAARQEEASRADQETSRADREAAARQEEAARADREAAARQEEAVRADSAEAEAAQLREQLARLQTQRS